MILLLRAFLRKVFYIKHERTQTEEKPFSCDQRGKSFHINNNKQKSSPELSKKIISSDK